LSARASTVRRVFDRWTDDRWTDEQVLALAPDRSSTAAARKLATAGPWTATGATPGAVWGSCQGSGRTPYQVAVDLAGTGSSCTCASRKFPCKHALGLLLLWSAGSVSFSPEPPDRVVAWLASRERRAGRAEARPAGDDADRRVAGAADADAGRRRAEQRERRMLDGLAELDQWLRDQVRSGLAGTDRAGYGPFEAVAARMVDAQVPGIAAVLRRLAAVAVSGEGWPGRLLEEYALLHLLARAAPAALAAPGTPFAATVRAHLGVNVPRIEVLAGPAERDRWRVLALRDDVEERLTARRVWLRGESTGALALVLTFAAPGQPLDTSLVPGTIVDADLHRYPGAVRLRALLGERRGTVRATRGVPGVTLDHALADRATALAADPWLRSWPAVLAGVVPVADGGGWWLMDTASSGTLPLVGGDPDWAFLATAGGGPVTLLAELLTDGVRTVSVLPPLVGATEGLAG
jgi:hypothetical protein